MRKRAKKLLALLTAVTITVTGVNVPAAQAAKVKVTASKTTLYYNGTGAEKKATVTVKNVKGKKVTYSISKAGKKIVKLGDVSGNKTKKFTVTAKKKGIAKVTVKVAGKKVKTIKFTVKKKTVKPTQEPTVAPTQEPTVAPTDEPTVAPTDEPTVAPTDAPSDAPTVAPTQEPVKDKSVVKEIKILNETALTNAAGDEAYVYYDVLDQYGESMRDSVTITWTTSPSNKRVSKSTGKITIQADTGSTFKYGDQLYVVGVEPKTGVSVSQTVKVGLAQQLDTISFEGFVKKSDKTKKLETIGSDFATGTDPYYLIYKAYDQNGSELDYDPALASNVLFTADAPMLLKLEADPAVPSVSIGEDTYFAIKVSPELYADKGGEVNITAIAKNTGNRVAKNYVIGDAGVLGSFEIQEPKSIITDGDQGVEIPFVAKDTAGNTITNYETIVRSTNTLSFTAGDNTTLKLSEQKDGTAKLTWSDKTNAYKENNYMTADAWNGVARPVSLTALVVGGTGSTLLLSVEDARIPEKLSIDNITVADRNSAAPSGLSFVDQYGDALNAGRAAAFVLAANDHNFGTDGADYQLRFRVVNANGIIDEVGSATQRDFDVEATYDNGGASKDTTTYVNGAKFVTPTLTSLTNAAGDVKTATIKSSVIKITAADTDNVSKASTSTYTVVPTSKLKAFEIDGICTTYRLNAATATFTGVDTATTTAAKGNIVNDGDIAVCADNLQAWGNTGLQLGVKGTYDGQKLSVYHSYLDWTTNDKVNMTASGAIAGILDGAVKYKDAYDLEAYGEPAKTFDLKITANVNLASPQPVTKNASFSLAEQKITSVEVVAGATNPDNTIINYNNCAFGWGSVVRDQFGHVISGANIVYSIQNIVESTSELTHVKDSVVVSGNENTNPYAIAITGLEVGDKYDLVATAEGTKISASTTVIMGADAQAYIANGDDADKTFRTSKLNYTR